jgi:chromosome segregation ATPase
VSEVKIEERAALDWVGRRADTTQMDERITLLEREVKEIKIEMVSMKASCARASECADIRTKLGILETKVDNMQMDIERLQRDVKKLQEDVTQVQRDVALLQKDVAQLQKDVAQLRADVDRIFVILEHIQANMLTKEELKTEIDAAICKVESRLGKWMAASIVSVVGLQVAMFGYFIAFR